MMEQGAIERTQLRAIDQFLEEYYEGGKTQEAGELMAVNGMKKSQLRGLENLIVSTTRFSEIVNYIKNQVGKEKRDDTWRKIGPKLLTQLEDLEVKAMEIAGEDPARRLQVKLHLAKGWARQVVAHYLYKAQDEGGR
ncbi:MAG: hypothetical protein V1792_09165 [Pseudomonadota bacterium]